MSQMQLRSTAFLRQFASCCSKVKSDGSTWTEVRKRKQYIQFLHLAQCSYFQDPTSLFTSCTLCNAVLQID
jgi:hypothetical protein